jgi:hypothetical protein
MLTAVSLRTRRARTFISASSFVLAVAAACSDSSAPSIPKSIEAVSAINVSGVVGTQLAPVSVRIKDSRGKGVSGVSVNWTALGGGQVSPSTSQTDGDGKAEATWTLGTTAGQQQLRATTPRLTDSAAVFVASATPDAVASISVEPSGVDFTALGDSLRFSATARDRYSNVVTGTSFTWTSSTQSVVTVNGSGLARSVSVGSAEILVSTGSLSTTVQARVTQEPARATVSPKTLTFNALGRTLGLSVTIADRNGFLIPGATQVWSSLDVNVATVDGTGLVRAIAPGTARIRIGSAGVADTAVTTVQQVLASLAIGPSAAVLSVGDTVRAGATATDSGGAAIPNPAVIWSTTASSVATVSAIGTIRAQAPGEATVIATSTSVPPIAAQIPVTVLAAPQGLDLRIDALYVTQSTQTYANTVPLIAGRNALLRIFVKANMNNTATPSVRVRFFRGGTQIDSLLIAPPVTGVPIVVNEGSLAQSWNVSIPGSLLQPGTSVSAVVDPAGLVDETDRTNNSFPPSGIPLTLDVRNTTPFSVRIVPVRQSANGLVGDVTTANLADYTSKALAMYPFPAVDADIRATYNYNGAISSAYDNTWSQLLNEILAVRTADNSTRHYYGVLKPSYSFGGTGLGYLGLPAAIGVDWSNYRGSTAAHEWGHNFNRSHVNCGGPANPDPQYPYATSTVGVYGYDIFASALKAPAGFADLMSYCSPEWISDYTYRAVMNFRGTSGGPVTESVTAGAAQRTLLVWGRITPDGMVLEPSFEITARPQLPARGGPYRIEGLDAAGGHVFDIAFAGDEIDHLPGVRTFAFAVPLAAGQNVPQMLRLTGGGRTAVRQRSAAAAARAAAADVVRVSPGAAGRVRLDWDATVNAVLMVRDPATGEIISFARGGVTELQTNASELDVRISDGIGSAVRRLRIQR